MYGVFQYQGFQQTGDGIDPSACLYVFQLELVRGHVFGVVNRVSVVFGPVMVKETLLVGLIDGRSWNKIHTLDQGTLDLVSDDKVS